MILNLSPKIYVSIVIDRKKSFRKSSNYWRYYSLSNTSKTFREYLYEWLLLKCYRTCAKQGCDNVWKQGKLNLNTFVFFIFCLLVFENGEMRCFQHKESTNNAVLKLLNQEIGWIEIPNRWKILCVNVCVFVLRLAIVGLWFFHWIVIK